VLYVGHWQLGAAATIGEEEEQVNSMLSRHFCSKHLTVAGMYIFLRV
jgi:hypothetical protein